MTALHGRRWRRRVGIDGEAGAYLLGRLVVELHLQWLIAEAKVKAAAAAAARSGR